MSKNFDTSILLENMKDKLWSINNEISSRVNDLIPLVNNLSPIRKNIEYIQHLSIEKEKIESSIKLLESIK